jgi:hypothetical protein
MTVCRRGLHPLRGHEGVRDGSFVLSAGPEALGRPRGCSLLLLFPVMVVDIARIGDPGRYGLFLSPDPGPPGVPIPARVGARDTLPEALDGLIGAPSPLIPRGSTPAGRMKEFFPEGNLYPLLSSTGTNQERSDLDIFIYILCSTPRKAPRPSASDAAFPTPKPGSFS